MAKSNLHIICGTCGNNLNLEYNVRPLDEGEKGDQSETDYWVNIYCPNCSTIHEIGDFLKPRPKN